VRVTSAKSSSGDDPPPAAGGSRRAAFVISLICAAQFVLQLDFSIVNVALPSIQRELGMPAAELQWIVTGYALAFGSLLLAGGRLADLLGRRRLLAGGLILTPSLWRPAAGPARRVDAPGRLTGRPTWVPVDAASPLRLEAYTLRPMQEQSFG
jgi:hypothetical protein